MKVGFIGLGKLGLPVSLAIEDKGHQIYGFDINNSIEGYIKKKKFHTGKLEPINY